MNDSNPPFDAYADAVRMIRKRTPALLAFQEWSSVDATAPDNIRHVDRVEVETELAKVLHRFHRGLTADTLERPCIVCVNDVNRMITARLAEIKREREWAEAHASDIARKTWSVVRPVEGN